MNLAEAFQKVWAKICRPNSMCPDIQIWDVRQALTEVLLEEDHPLLGSNPSKFAYAALLIGPLDAVTLSHMWCHVNPLKLEGPRDTSDPNYNEELEDYWTKQEVHEALLFSDIEEALNNLTKANLITLDTTTALYSVVR